MTWFGWLMVAGTVLSILAYVAAIGKPRDAITSSMAVVYVAINGLMLVGVLVVGTGKL